MSTSITTKVSRTKDLSFCYLCDMGKKGSSLNAIFFVVCFVLWGSTASAQSLWRGIQYGASMEDVSRIFPDAKRSALQSLGVKNGTGSTDDLIVDGFGAAPCSLVIYFTFSGSPARLADVTVSTHAKFVKISHTAADQCANKILSDLTEKYGFPNISGYYKENDWKAFIWQRKDGVFIEYKYLEFASIEVRYSKQKPEDLIQYRQTRDAL